MHGEGQATRGVIGDRPWGSILGGLGVAARTVQLTLRSDGKVYRIAFDRGLVVAASSPVPADTMTRIALSNHLIASTQVDELKRRISGTPNADDVDVLATTAQLDPEQTRALRNRVLLQRAARTFAIDQGEYEIEDRMPVAIKGIGIDIRGVIFAGARMNLSEDRLRAYLRELSPKLALDPRALDTLDRYGFSPAEQPVLDALRVPTSLAQLEATHRDIDPRAIQAVVYALGSCGALAESKVAVAEAVVTFPDPSRVEALMKDKAPTMPPATRATTVQITERVRPARAATIERDELKPDRIPNAALTSPMSRQTRSSVSPSTASSSQPRVSVPPATASSSQSGVSVATASSSQSGVSVPPATTSSSQSGVSVATASSSQSGVSVPPSTASSSQSGVSVPPSTASSSQSGVSVPPSTASSSQSGVSVPPSTTSSSQSGVSNAPKPSRAATGEGTPSPREGKRGEVEALSRALESFELEPPKPAAQPKPPRKVTSVGVALKRQAAIELINERTALIASGADHFTLLGVPIGASIEEVDTAYTEVSRLLHPAYLAELGIRDEVFAAESVLAQLDLAVAVLTDRVRRPAYIEMLRAKQHKPR